MAKGKRNRPDGDGAASVSMAGRPDTRQDTAGGNTITVARPWRARQVVSLNLGLFTAAFQLVPDAWLLAGNGHHPGLIAGGGGR